MTHAGYRCDCGHMIGTPSIGSRVVGLTCGECSKHYRISYIPGQLLGKFAEWRCPTCNGDKRTWCTDLRGCIKTRIESSL